MEYMRSVRQRNLFYRGIALLAFILLGIFLSTIIPKTSAHEDEVVPDDTLPFETVPAVSTHSYEIKEGDTLLAILQLEAGISYELALPLLDGVNEVFDITKIRQGSLVNIKKEDTVFVSLSYDINTEEELLISKREGGFTVVRKDIEYEVRESSISGTVEDSFYQSALDAGLTDRMIMELATVFAWDVDFTSSVQEGDEFSLVFQNKYREGEFSGTGDLLAGRFVNNGNEYFTYLVKDKNGNNKYYNEDGEATERLLLKTPLSYKRISSGFTMSRKHPILGTFKTHRAIDFAASTGTPVETVGDGTVVYAGWNGAYGNFVKIDHGQGFATAYAHLSKIYVSKGSRVKQSDLIGAVGSTGRSTGPHLHYEMYKNGALVHPLDTKTPSGTPISEEQKPLLEAVVTEYKKQL
jgi:murein DD-endopeptidase MepM/ murein hydrolase activator NlpD